MLPLKPHNTFGIDVKAEQFVEWDLPEKTDCILSEIDEKTLVLGGGSNVLFTQDFEGKVVKMGLKGVSLLEERKKEVLVEVAAGEIWDEFVAWSGEKNYSGVENLTLIPGTVGAAPIQNIGAYGVEVKEVIEGVWFYNRKTKKKEYLENKNCLFSYRNSIFKTKLKGKSIITSVVFRLKKYFSPPIVEYADIKKWFQENEKRKNNTKCSVCCF